MNWAIWKDWIYKKNIANRMINIRNTFTCLLVFISFLSLSQKEVEKEKFYTNLTWSIVAFNFDIAKQNTKLSNSLPNDYNFLMSSNYKYLITMNFVEVQLLYKNFIGLSIGLDYSNMGIKNESVYNEIQNHVTDISISIPETNYEKGSVPISDDQDVFSSKIALVGNINYKKISFVPFIAGIFAFQKCSLEINAKCFDSNNNTSFDRKYSFEEAYSPGLKIGFDTRYMLTNNLFLGARIGYSYINMKGYAKTVDTFENGDQILSNSSNFHRINNNLYFGANIGLIFGYGYRKVVSSKS